MFCVSQQFCALCFVRTCAGSWTGWRRNVSAEMSEWCHQICVWKTHNLFLTQCFGIILQSNTTFLSRSINRRLSFSWSVRNKYNINLWHADEKETLGISIWRKNTTRKQKKIQKPTRLKAWGDKKQHSKKLCFRKVADPPEIICTVKLSLLTNKPPNVYLLN